MTCPSCGADNRPDAKFCFECGWALARTCPNGHPVLSDARFCDECGAAVTGTAQAAAAPVTSAPAAERRLVSVLFADLVGFTAASEQRDAEDTRELLSRYFDTSRRLIELYGGTVEKFIGDAVMAVWGTPTATEDDAERAVRAALDLVAAVSALGDEVGAPELRARAGVLTGEAAVTIGAEGQGMVAGDLVNTASRVQSAAEPGMVFVGESTRRSTEQTIVYEDAGSFELKGKEGLTPLWRAQRVVSGLRGSLKSQGLEAPFVGRDRELRQIKDLFHSSADEHKAHLVSLTGIAGIGKSRLSWEFYKYFDGIADTVYWHRGRCLSYGEGVTYWALADMVRMRCRISEEEEPASALSKLHATLEEHFLDAEERTLPRASPRAPARAGRAPGARPAGPLRRLAALLRAPLGELSDGARLRGHAVGRREPARLRRVPARLVAEPPDLRGHARTAGVDGAHGRPGAPGSGASHRCISSRSRSRPWRNCWPVSCLGSRSRFATASWRAPKASRSTRSRPCGCCSTAACSCRTARRTAHGRGRSARSPGDAARPHRGTTRRPVRGGAAAAPGRGGSRQDVHARGVGRPLGLRGRSRAGARRPRTQGGARCAGRPASPEHGQYGFLQDLVRHVAYETLSKKERRARHLAAAAHLSAAFAEDEDEVVEVIASHYLAAYEAAPDADDAGDIKARPGRRSCARESAPSHSLPRLRQGATSSRRPTSRTSPPIAPCCSTAPVAWPATPPTGPTAERLLGESIASARGELGDTHARLPACPPGSPGRLLHGTPATRPSRHGARFRDHRGRRAGRGSRGVGRTTWAAATSSAATSSSAAERVDLAIDLAEAHRLPGGPRRALRAKALSPTDTRPEESTALLEQQSRDRPRARSLRGGGTALFILSDLFFRRDRYDDALDYLDEALALARRRGSRTGEWASLAETTYPLCMLGRWDEALEAFAEVPEEQCLGRDDC